MIIFLLYFKLNLFPCSLSWLCIKIRHLRKIVILSSADGGTPASERIARAGHCKRFLNLKLTSASAPNVSYSVLEDLLQVMQKQLEELSSLHAAKMRPYQQLIERVLSTEEAVSASLMQDEASELEYRARVAGLRDRLRASSPCWG